MSTTESAPPTERRRPGRPRRRPVDEERRTVLDAACAVFAERGFDGATIEAVARVASVPRPTVYELFGSKDLLAAAVVEDAAELMLRRLSVGFSADPDATWEDVVRRGYAATFELIEDHPDAVTVLLLAERSGAFPAGSGIAGARQRVLGEIAGIGRGQWEQFGARIGPASEIVALMLYAMGEALARRQLEEGWDKDTLIELLTTFTSGGLIALWKDDLRQLRALDGARTKRQRRR